MIMSEWKKIKIGDVCDTISQTFKSNVTEVVLINTSDVLEGKVLNHEKVPNEKLKGQFKKEFKKDDILYSEIRPKNKRFAYVDFDSEGYIASTKLMVLRSKLNMIYPPFLFQILKSDKIVNELQMIAEARSGTFPQITFNELPNLEIHIPSVEKQKGIAEFLGYFDRKIELNNKLNANLMDIANTYYQKHCLRNSEQCELKIIDDIVEFFDAKRKPLSSRQREQMQKIYPYYGAASLVDYVDNYIFDGDYVLVSEDGANVVNELGYPLMQYVWGKFWVNNHAHILKGKNTISDAMAYFILANTNMSIIVTGAAQPKINQANLKALNVVIPKESVFDEFKDIADRIMEQSKCLLSENMKLKDIRDLLLPKFMTGDIHLSDVELDL